MNSLKYYGFIQFVFTVLYVEGYGNMLTQGFRQLAFTSHKAFSKKQKGVWN